MKKLSVVVCAVVLFFVSTHSMAFWGNRSYTKTEYPIVLVHGISGFDSIGGLINYFHTVPYNLERSGATVYVPSVSAFNASEVRGQQLADFLTQLPEEKFNLIGHSQGAPTSRVAAALVPNKVASVTSVNGVNQGSVVADVVLGVLPDGIGRNLAGSIANALGDVISFLSGASAEQDGIASAITLSTEGTARLNEQLNMKGLSNNCSSISENVNIDGNNIKMFSWTGSRPVTNVFDISDAALGITGLAFQGSDNDGLTSVCSAKLGNVIGVYSSLNHLDAVNHLFGVRGWVNPVSLYRSHANRLKNRGL